MNNSVNKFAEIKLDKDNLIKNKWLEFCREKNISYITINSKIKLADVLWDCISYPMGYEELFSKNDEYLRTEFLKIYSKYATSKSKFNISSSSVSFCGFFIEDAKAAANDIFDVVDNLVAKNNQ